MVGKEAGSGGNQRRGEEERGIYTTILGYEISNWKYKGGGGGGGGFHY